MEATIAKARAKVAKLVKKHGQIGDAFAQCRKCIKKWRRNGSRPELMPPNYPLKPKLQNCPICSSPLRTKLSSQKI